MFVLLLHQAQRHGVMLLSHVACNTPKLQSMSRSATRRGCNPVAVAGLEWMHLPCRAPSAQIGDVWSRLGAASVRPFLLLASDIDGAWAPGGGLLRACAPALRLLDQSAVISVCGRNKGAVRLPHSVDPIARASLLATHTKLLGERDTERSSLHFHYPCNRPSLILDASINSTAIVAGRRGFHRMSQ